MVKVQLWLLCCVGCGEALLQWAVSALWRVVVPGVGGQHCVDQQRMLGGAQGEAVL